MAKEGVVIKGFLNKAKKNASGSVYKGRFTCNDVQWTGEGSEALITFTITAQEIADAAENHLLWTDQDVQRGVLPGLTISPPRILPLSEGYPDPRHYVFNVNNADDMVEKLLSGERLFLSPLVWNLRPGFFEAYWNTTSREVYLYSGKIYLPDSHHRQQAIIKAVKIWRDAPDSYPKFSPSKQFKVELYFLSKEDEGNYFFDKNQRPKPTAKSKAYDLTTLDDLSLLAKNVITKSSALKDNVNRVTDRLTSKNAQVITLSTLREMMKAFAKAEALDDPEMEGLATVAATFYDLLSQVRRELATLPIIERRRVREALIVDSAVMMHGYAALMSDFNDTISEKGLKGAISDWQKRLDRFSGGHRYRFGHWSGDLFEKINPLWQHVGVVKPGKDGKRLTVLNTGGARSECGRVLRQLASIGAPPNDLAFLSKR
jgi:hypothetical protein